MCELQSIERERESGRKRERERASMCGGREGISECVRGRRENERVCASGHNFSKRKL